MLEEAAEVGSSDAARPGNTVGHVLHASLANTETFVHNQINSLRRYRPVVVAHHRRPETHFRFERAAIAQDLLTPTMAAVEAAAYRTTRLALPAGVGALARYLIREDTRLLHYHYLTDARFLLGLKKRTGLPAVVSGYGYDVSSVPRALNGLGRHYLRPVFSRLDLFLAMSEDMRRDLVAMGCPPERIRVHYYGSDTRRFRHPGRCYDRSERPPVVLCCARLQRAKGQHLVVRALRLVRQSGHDFQLVVVGDGPARHELVELVSEFGLQDRTRFEGHVPYLDDRLVAHFHEADVFAHPSLTLAGLKEGIPGTIVEAMAAGLPVVATKHAGIPAVVESGTNGLLVEEGDVEGLADALRALLANARLREKLGRSAADRAARELDLQARTRVLETIYDDLLPAQ